MSQLPFALPPNSFSLSLPPSGPISSASPSSSTSPAPPNASVIDNTPAPTTPNSFGLALPSVSASGSGSSHVNGVKRKSGGDISKGKGKVRRRAQGHGRSDLGDTELNEADDVADDDLIAGPERRFKLDDDGEGEESEEDEDDDAEADGEEQEQDQDQDQGQATEHGIREGGEKQDDSAQARSASGSGLALPIPTGQGRRIKSDRGDGGSLMRNKGKEIEIYDEEAVKERMEEQKKVGNNLSQISGAEDLKRLEAFSLASLPRQAIRRPLSDNLLRPLAGIAKVFVTEVVEIAKDIQESSPHPTGPLQPYHLQLARQVMIERGVLGASSITGEGWARRPNPLS